MDRQLPPVDRKQVEESRRALARGDWVYADELLAEIKTGKKALTDREKNPHKYKGDSR
jgi:hypothetical protein